MRGLSQRRPENAGPLGPEPPKLKDKAAAPQRPGKLSHSKSYSQPPRQFGHAIAILQIHVADNHHVRAAVLVTFERGRWFNIDDNTRTIGRATIRALEDPEASIRRDAARILRKSWFIEQTEPVGHAVRATYMYSGMADIAALLVTPPDTMADRLRRRPDELSDDTAQLAYALDKLLSRSLRGMFDGPSTVPLRWDGPGLVLDLSESRVSQIHKDVIHRLRRRFKTEATELVA